MRVLVAIFCVAALAVLVFAVVSFSESEDSTPVASAETDGASDDTSEADAAEEGPDPKYPKCKPPSETIAENDEIRVFSLDEDIEGSYAGDVFVCLRSTGEWNFFFVRDFGGYPENLEMNGVFLVAETDSGCAADCYQPPIDYSFLNAETGDDYLLEEIESNSEQFFAIGNAVLSDDGVVIYSVDRGAGSERSEYYHSLPKERPAGTEIVRFDSRSEKREVLDSGEGIDIKSLKRNGTSVSWTHAGTVRSATL